MIENELLSLPETGIGYQIIGGTKTGTYSRKIYYT
jgi:hypothetical protein